MLMQCKSLRYLTFKSMHRLFDNCIKLGNGISVVQNIFIYTHASYHRNSRLLFDFMMFIFPMKWHMIAFFFFATSFLSLFIQFPSQREKKKKNWEKKLMILLRKWLIWNTHKKKWWIPLKMIYFDWITAGFLLQSIYLI